MRRILGVFVGVGTQLVFLVTAIRLYFFLDGGNASAPAGSRRARARDGRWPALAPLGRSSRA